MVRQHRWLKVFDRVTDVLFFLLAFPATAVTLLLHEWLAAAIYMTLAVLLWVRIKRWI